MIKKHLKNVCLIASKKFLIRLFRLFFVFPWCRRECARFITEATILHDEQIEVWALHLLNSKKCGADANPILEEQKCIVPFWNNIYVWFPLFKIMSSKIELRRQTMKLIKSNGFAHVASYNCVCVDLFWLNKSVILIVFQLLSLCIDQTIVGVKDKYFSVELMQSNKQWNRWLNLLMRLKNTW